MMKDDDDKALFEYLDSLDDKDLKRVTDMLNVKLIIEQLNKSNHEVAKLQKEIKFYPWLSILIALISSSALTAFITYLILQNPVSK